MTPTFFETPAEFGAWLDRHHDSEIELVVGFHKKGAGKPSMSWPESVEEALCFGWIDGVRRRVDDSSYTIRFTPRKRRSTWSAVNVAKAEELKREGRMRPAGLKAYEARTEDNTGIYGHEREQPAELPEEYGQRLRRNARAAAYFKNRPPGYRRTATHWVISAKREETRLRRLNTLIECSAEGLDVPPLRRP